MLSFLSSKPCYFTHMTFMGALITSKYAHKNGIMRLKISETYKSLKMEIIWISLRLSKSIFNTSKLFILNFFCCRIFSNEIWKLYLRTFALQTRKMYYIFSSTFAYMYKTNHIFFFWLHRSFIHGRINNFFGNFLSRSCIQKQLFKVGNMSQKRAFPLKIKRGIYFDIPLHSFKFI